MVEDIGDAAEEAETELTRGADVHKDAWGATIEDMEAMANELEEEGWDVTYFAAGHTGAPDADETGGYPGLAFVMPDNFADAVGAAVEDGSFPTYDVFRNEVSGRVFLLVQLLDPETEQAILVAGNFWRYDAQGMISDMREADAIYTHFQRLDGSVVAMFEHEDYSKFFPEADRLPEDMEPDWDELRGEDDEA